MKPDDKLGPRRDLADAMIDRERVSASRWFGVSIAAAPIANVLDDTGWFTLLAELRHGVELPPAWRLTLGWTALFVVLAVAGSMLLRLMSPRDRWWLFTGAAVPTVLYVLGQGVRPGAVIALAALVASATRLRAINVAG